MKRQIRLLVENLFDDLYDIDQETNQEIDLADNIYYKSKEDLREEIEYELKKQGPDADLNMLDTRFVTDMSHLFQDLEIQKIKIDKWDVSNVTDMSYMFEGCYDFIDKDLGNWNVSNVTNMSHMFENCGYNFFGIGLDNWDVSKVTDMSWMFYGCVELKFDLSKWNVNNVINMEGMFCVDDLLTPKNKNTLINDFMVTQ